MGREKAGKIRKVLQIEPADTGIKGSPTYLEARALPSKSSGDVQQISSGTVGGP